jgi:hypothetical protein
MRRSRQIGLAVLLGLALVTGCAPAATSPPATATATEAKVEPTATPPPTEEASPWEAVLQTQIEQPTRMAAFLNEGLGFTGGAGDPGRAHITTDGTQWTPADGSLG